MAATTETVQQYVAERVRTWAELFRKTQLLAHDNILAIDEIYAYLIANPDWVEVRADFPPFILTRDDILAWNAFVQGFEKFCNGTFANVGEANSFAANMSVVFQACVRPPQIV